MASPATAAPTTTPAVAPVKKVASKPKTSQLKKKAPRKGTKVTIDVSKPVNDGIMDAGNFEKYLTDKIKVTRGAKPGITGDAIKIAREKNKITVSSDSIVAKKYLKFLTKRYLKKNNIRDWLHVISTGPQAYELKYYNIHEEEEGEEEEDS